MATYVARTGNNLSSGNFIPAIWSRKLNAKYYAQTFLPLITNSTYEG